MEPRMKSPVFSLPGSRETLHKLAKTSEDAGVPTITLELVQARVGQINGCAPCVDIHTRILKKRGERDQRIFTLAVWRETPYFTEPERAALALAEAVTRLSDRTNAVPDEVWAEASKHFSETALSGLLLAIGVANLWNRLNVPTHQVTGDFVDQYI